MLNTSIYRDTKKWKTPIHFSKSFAAKTYLKALKNIDVIGITGSVGKTLTQNAVASVLSQKFRVAVGEENLDPTFRIPNTISKMAPWTNKLVLEYGVERPGDMSHYLNIAKPTVAVVTHISPTHTKYFGSIEGVFDEKSKIITALPKNGFAILNADDPSVVKMANLTVAKVVWFGQKIQDGVKISHFKQTTQGSSFRLHYKGQKATVNWKVVGRQHLLAANAAATVGIVSGLTLKQIAKGLSQTKSPAHRLQPLVKDNWTILDDTYNSSPKAAKESIKTLLDLGKNKYKIAVLGEMKDLGDLSEKEHKNLGQKIAKTRINLLITVGPIAKVIGTEAKRAGFSGSIKNLPSASQIIKSLKKFQSKKAAILIKASRHEHFEQIVDGLLGKSTAIYCFHCDKLN